MQRIFLSLISAFCLICFTSGATVREEKIAENLAKLQKHPHDTRLLKETGYLYLNIGDYDKALAFGQRLLSESKDDAESQLHAHIILGQAYTDIPNQPEALNHLETARVMGEAQKNHDALCSVYNGLGIFYNQIRGNRPQALAAYTRALAEADSAKNESKQAMVLYNLSGMWLYGDQNTESRYALRAYEKAHETNDIELEFHCCVVLSGFGIISQNATETKHWLDKASDLLKRNNLDNLKTYLNVATANYYAFTGENSKAMQFYREAYDNIGELSLPMQTNLCSLYGKFLIENKQPTEGIGMLKNGLRHAVNTSVGIDSCALLLAIANGYGELGDYRNAYEAMEQLRQVRERKIAMTDEQNYAENRIKNDIRLNELQIQQQKVKLLEGERNLIIVIGIALMLGVALAMLLYFYRRKNRLYRSIVIQNRQTMERERVLMESLESERNKTPETTQHKTGSDEKLADLADRFMLLMIEQHLYTDPNISIASVAEAMGTNRTYLSRAINTSTGHSFSEVVNQYRIRHAIELISDSESNHQLKYVAASVGFNSKSAFYTAFRNLTGMTPTQYREKASETSK